MRTSSQPFLSVAAAERGEDSSASSGEREESGGTEQSGFRVETVFDALDEHVERFRFRAEVRFGDVAGEGEVVEEKEEFAFGEEEGGGRCFIFVFFVVVGAVDFTLVVNGFVEDIVRVFVTIHE